MSRLFEIMRDATRQVADRLHLGGVEGVFLVQLLRGHSRSIDTM